MSDQLDHDWLGLEGSSRQVDLCLQAFVAVSTEEWIRLCCCGHWSEGLLLIETGDYWNSF